MKVTRTFKQTIKRLIPGTYATETFEREQVWKGAEPLPNDHREANYKKQSGRSELTPRQARRVRKHNRRKGTE